jgi:hypothetical protein
MSNRTQTVQNGGGIHGPRDVIWGPEVRRVVYAVIGLLVTILGWSVVDRLTMEHRVTAIERAEFTEAQERSIDRIVKGALGDKLDAYPTRTEIERGKAEIAAKVLENQEETQRQLRAIRKEFKEDAMYNRRVLSTIDLTGSKEKDR